MSALVALALTTASLIAPASAIDGHSAREPHASAHLRVSASLAALTSPTLAPASTDPPEAIATPPSDASTRAPTSSSADASPDTTATSLGTATPAAPTTSPDTTTSPATTTSPDTTTPPATTTSPAATTPPAATTSPEPTRPRWWGPEPRPKVSGYGGPAVRLSGLHGNFAAFVGLEGGINILQRVTIGAALQWLLNPVEAGAFAVGVANRINLNYGGLVVDVAYVRGKRVAGTLGGLLGGGGGCLQNPDNGRCADRTAFFVGEPRAGLRVTLAPVVRLHLALGYRLVAARTWAGPRDLGGPVGTVALEFGWF